MADADRGDRHPRQYPALVLALALGASLIAGGAQAAPLCKDLKGLFTPCPKELNAAASRRLEAQTLRQWARHKRSAPAPTGDAQTSVVTATPPAPPTRLPFVAGVTVSDPGKRTRPKLCKDLKGLFTPCPKP